MLILSNLFILSYISDTAPTCDTRVPQPLGSNAWWSEAMIWCNNNRNKVHNKCNAFESSPNHPPSTLVCRKKLSSMKLAPWNQKVEDCCLDHSSFCPSCSYRERLGVIAADRQFFLALLSPAPSQRCQEEYGKCTLSQSGFSDTEKAQKMRDECVFAKLH